MNRLRSPLAVVSVVSLFFCLCASAPAATIYYTDGGSGNNIDDPLNWGGTLPGVGDIGVIDTAVTVTMPGTLGGSGNPLDGATIRLDNAGAILDSSGVITTSANISFEVLSGQFTGRHMRINGGTYSQSGGTMALDAQLDGNGTFSASSGTLTFGTNPTNGEYRGGFTLTGDAAVSGGNLNIGFSGSSTLGLGTGSVNITNGVIKWDSAFDFVTGSGFSLSVAGYTATDFQTEYTEGDLLADGDNSAPFSSVFQVSGNSVSLIPEPASAMLFLGGLSVLLLRRRRTAL